jgi:Nickel responsive protein SCO4226-like
MKKFVVERILPGAGSLNAEELKEMSRVSCEIITRMGKPYHWIQSFVTEDKIYCIHITEGIEDVREHARLGNFPINTISEVSAIIDPWTGTIPE